MCPALVGPTARPASALRSGACQSQVCVVCQLVELSMPSADGGTDAETEMVSISLGLVTAATLLLFGVAFGQVLTS